MPAAPQTPAARSPPPPDVVPVRVELRFDDRRLSATVPAPAGRVSPGRMLHVLQSLADTLVNLAVGKAAASGGQRLACRAGCGACCRQLVPIAPTEARRVAAVVAALPEPRRSAVRARFASAADRLDAAGLLDRLRQSEHLPEAALEALAQDYFRAGVPCPLLDGEACSIYADRPLVCREYLVSSDPVHCNDPTGGRVERIAVRGKLGGAVGRWERQMDHVRAGHDANGPAAAPPAGGAVLPWVPLVLAPEWAAVHPEPEPSLTGPQQVRAMMTALTGKPVGEG